MDPAHRGAQRAPARPVAISALGHAQRGAFDTQGQAAVAQAVEQRLDHLLVAQKSVPVVVFQVGRDQRGFAVVVALLHQLEEDVALLGSQVQVPKLVDQQDVDAREPVEQLSRSPVGERGVHLVKQVLRFDEEATIALMQRSQQDCARQTRLADAGGADPDDIAASGDKVELGELFDDAAVGARLLGPRVGAQGPAFGQVRSADAVLEEALLLRDILAAKDAPEEIAVAGAGLLCPRELLIQALAQTLQFEAREQLLQVAVHGRAPGGRWECGRNRQRCGVGPCARCVPDR